MILDSSFFSLLLRFVSLNTELKNSLSLDELLFNIIVLEQDDKNINKAYKINVMVSFIKVFKKC